jgi:HEAT repeat protein
MPTGLREVRRLKAQGDVDGLLQALGVANKRQVRRKAAEALGDVGGARAVQALVTLLDDEDYELRTISVVALGKIGDTRAVEPLAGWLDWRKLASFDRRRLLMEYSFSKAWDFPEAVVEALGEIGDTGAVEALSDVLRRGDIEEIEVSAEGAVLLPDKLRYAAGLPTRLGESAVHRRQRRW